jgi:hypothetical protein
MQSDKSSPMFRKKLPSPASGRILETLKQEIKVYILRDSPLAYYLILKMEAIPFSETSVNISQSAQLHTPANIIFNSHYYKELAFNVLWSPTG